MDLDKLVGTGAGIIESVLVAIPDFALLIWGVGSTRRSTRRSNSTWSVKMVKMTTVYKVVLVVPLFSIKLIFLREEKGSTYRETLFENGVLRVLPDFQRYCL